MALKIKNDMEQAKEQFDNCLNLMHSRNEKYGDSWKMLGKDTIVDLIAMKLDRCKKQNLDNEAIKVELEDIVNYGIFGLMRINHYEQSGLETTIEEDMVIAQNEFDTCSSIMISRNKKYGDARKLMRLSSLIDLISAKTHRSRTQTLDNKALSLELIDIVNYSILGLVYIKINSK